MHEATLANLYRQQLVAGLGPDRRAYDGPALHLPLQRQLDHEPDPRRLPRPRLLLQPLPRQAPRARGRRGRSSRTRRRGSSTPSTTRATSTSSSRCWPRRPTCSRSRPSTRSPSPPTRGTSTSTGRATPTTASTRFYMWYWCAHALQHLGRVIIVGGDRAAVRRLGFSPASTLADALELAEDVVGRDPTITHLHMPPLIAGRGHVTRPRCPRARRAPARRPALRADKPTRPVAVARAVARSASSASTTTPPGHAATRYASPGRWCSTTSRGRCCASRCRLRSSGSTTSTRSRAR